MATPVPMEDFISHEVSSPRALVHNQYTDFLCAPSSQLHHWASGTKTQVRSYANQQKHTYLASSKMLFFFFFFFKSEITKVLDFFPLPLKAMLFTWNASRVHSYQNLKPRNLQQYDAVHTQAPSELEAKSFPENCCPGELQVLPKRWPLWRRPGV